MKDSPDEKEQAKDVKTISEQEEGFQLKKMQDAFDEVERRLKIAYPKALRWDKLRNWLTNLVNKPCSTVNKTEKKGIRIALNIMDRIEEADKGE